MTPCRASLHHWYAGMLSRGTAAELFCISEAFSARVMRPHQVSRALLWRKLRIHVGEIGGVLGNCMLRNCVEEEHSCDARTRTRIGVMRLLIVSPRWVESVSQLPTVFGKAEILAEKWQHVVLESIGHRTGVCAGVDLKAVCDSVVIQDLVQLDCVEA